MLTKLFGPRPPIQLDKSDAHQQAQSSAGWWCVTATDVDICKRERTECERERERVNALGLKPSACAARPNAFCYLSTPPGEPQRLNCSGSMSFCQKDRENSAYFPKLAGKLESDCAEQH